MKKELQDGILYIFNQLGKNCLKPRGFKRKGNSYKREKRDVIEIVSLQTHRSIQPNEILFTINLSIRIKLLGECDTYYPGIFHGGHWTERLGALLDKDTIERLWVTNSLERWDILAERLVGKDNWWALRTDSDVEFLTKEVAKVLCEKGIPLLEENASEEKILEKWVSGQGSGILEHPYISAAVFLKLRGDDEGSERMIQKVLDNEGEPGVNFLRSRIEVAMQNLRAKRLIEKISRQRESSK
ncbi:MAG TPA: DUF4304 domain-containing protein [Fimbriimonadales bacterium]|nr:DUF4304 domain-containing protein [Fimbriimonadales bacterium]